MGKRTRAFAECLAVLLGLLLLCGGASADSVSYGSVSFDRDAEYIDLGVQQVTNWKTFIAFLREFPNLKKVDMFATKIEAKYVEQLEQAFPDVAFGWYLQMMRYHFIRTDANAYSALDGAHPKHSGKEFALLRYCRNLLALDVGHNDIRDPSFLENMPGLRVLILADNQKLKNVERIAVLEHLEYLELFSCGIEDISPLTALTNLMDLNLSNNRVKDWRPLKEMKWLKRLWISGMCTGKRTRPELTVEERKELEEALPDTEIVYVGEPTDNGWRYLKKNEPAPHYAVIREMFYGETQHYVPFAESPPLPGEETTDPAPSVPENDFTVEDVPLEDLLPDEPQ